MLRALSSRSDVLRFLGRRLEPPVSLHVPRIYIDGPLEELRRPLVVAGRELELPQVVELDPVVRMELEEFLERLPREVLVPELGMSDGVYLKGADFPG